MIDDQADYYNMNQWISSDDREKFMKKQEEFDRLKNEKSKKSKLSFDFAGRSIILADDAPSYEQLYQSFTNATTLRPNPNGATATSAPVTKDVTSNVTTNAPKEKTVQNNQTKKNNTSASTSTTTSISSGTIKKETEGTGNRHLNFK